MMSEDNLSSKSQITDHSFTPKNKMYWELCEICHLAAAAHETNTASMQLSSQDDRTELGHQVTRMKQPPEERPNPLPVPEVDASWAQEHMVGEQEGDGEHPR